MKIKALKRLDFHLLLQELQKILVSKRTLHIQVFWETQRQDVFDQIFYQFYISMEGNRSSDPQKIKKKYKKMAKKEQLEISNMSQDNGDLTATQIQFGMSNISISKIGNNDQSINQTAKSLIGQHLNLLKKRSSSIIQEDINLYHQKQFRNCKEIFEDKDTMRPLKKFIKQTIQQITDIQIFYSLQRPSIVFQYKQKTASSKKRKCQLRDLLKANKQFGKSQSDCLWKIFNTIYNNLNEQFIGIMEAVYLIAEKERVQIKKSSRKTASKLYYQVYQKQINFVLFDEEMRMFQFEKTAIEANLQKKTQRAWKKFMEFLAKNTSSRQNIPQQLYENQASSDEQDRSKRFYEQKIDARQIQRRIHTIIRQTDILAYQQQIEEKQAQLSQLKDENNDKNKPQMEMIAQNISELFTNVQNFKKTQEAVKRQMKLISNNERQYPHKLKNLLKRMILAQKQLESRLPICARKEEILRALEKDDLIILEGQTGSGKSTQLPQILCQYLKIFEQKGKKCLPILVTQPRKLATRTVAQRVASELDQTVGGFVDYTTSQNRQVNRQARIIFKLDTLVLDQITSDRLLSKYSCLVIDQAHQRTISIDVILGLIIQLLKNRKGFKVIVTSASLDAQLFASYFKRKVMKVSGRLHPVQIVYRPLASQNDLVRKVEKHLKDEIFEGTSEMKPGCKGDVLIFCSGVQEISQLCLIFQRYLNPRVFQVYPLHGRIAVQEQRRIFFPTKEYKVVFASRIAQTSITIQKVKVVVDPGYDRQQVYDQKNRVSSRKLMHISQSSAKQRAGRAGRTSSGKCFRLYSQFQFQNFRSHKTPQIENMALDTLVLRLKALGVSQIFTFAYIHKPSDEALEKSVQTLQLIGALGDNGQITAIGRLLLQLQIEPFLGRAIVEAILTEQLINATDFRARQLDKIWKKQELKKLQFVRYKVVQILCMVINSSTIFSSSFDFRKYGQKVEEIKFHQFSDDRGDFFYLQNIYEQFLQKNGTHDLSKWIYNRFLNKKTLFQVKELTQEINMTIKNFKLDRRDPINKNLLDKIKSRLKDCRTADEAILSCMMTSFCVNLCLYSQNPYIGYTLVLQRKPVVIYGTSTLSLLSLYPKWIVCYQLKNNEKGTTYCQIAQRVEFDFLKKTVDDIVFQKLNLREADKINPFYDTIERALPSAIIQDILSEYFNRDENSLPILNYLAINPRQQSNKLAISYSKQLKMSDITKDSIKKNVGQQISMYINDKLKQKKGKPMVFHLVSNIYLQMDHGFKVTRIYLSNRQTQFIVEGNQQFLKAFKATIFSNIISFKFINPKMRILTLTESDYKQIKKKLVDNKFIYKENIKQTVNKSLCAKIYMKFYTGKLEKNGSFFIYFGKREPNFINQMANILETVSKDHKKLVSKQAKDRYFTILTHSKFRPSKNSTGVKCFNDRFDAFQIKEAIENLTVCGIMPYSFILPQNVRQQRQSNSQMALRTDSEWQKQIKSLLLKEGFPTVQVSLKREQQGQGNIDRIVGVELSAQITGKSIQQLDALVKRLDGRQGLIGQGKIHFRYSFRQQLVKINKRVFEALKDRFKYLKQKFEIINAQMKIQKTQRSFGKHLNVFINCRSPIRENLLEPSEAIRQLFTPFMIRLQTSEFNYFNNTEHGNDFLYQLEDKRDFKIYFGFQRQKGLLKVYCEEEKQFLEIENSILKHLENLKYSVQTINYKGKGLHHITKIIEEQSKKYSLEHRIVFRKREIEIEGNPIGLKKVFEAVAKLGQIVGGSCGLCNHNCQKPYRLLLCDHVFCYKCLGDYIQQARKEQNHQDILCPEDNCQKLSPFDVRAILSQEEFENFGLKKMKYFLKATNRYFKCPTSGCHQIFEESVVQKQKYFECGLCGKWYCGLCREPHQHFNCQQWRAKLEKGQLARFGFKLCKCGATLKKEARGKDIKCKKCNEYLCWVCLKGWTREKDCQNHTRVCKK